MAWVLRLIETGADGQGRSSIDVLEISRPNTLRDIATLGLTLPEAKQLLARVQQAVVAAQARDHAALRPECSSCGGRCQVKDWRSHQIATPFGGVVVRLPRFRCSGCGRGETGTRWPAHCRSTPEKVSAAYRMHHQGRAAAGMNSYHGPLTSVRDHSLIVAPCSSD